MPFDEFLDPVGEEDYYDYEDNNNDPEMSTDEVQLPLPGEGSQCYGFHAAEDDPQHALLQTSNEHETVQEDARLPIRHQMTATFQAVTNPTISSAAAPTSSRKHSEPHTDSEDNDGTDSGASDDMAVHHAKRPRTGTVSPVANPRPALGARVHNSRQAPGVQRAGSRMSPWTAEEINMLVAARYGGMNWDDVHDVSGCTIPSPP